MHRILGHVLFFEKDPPAVRPHQADDHVKARGFSRAIRSQQANDLAAVNIDVHAIHHGASAIDFDQLIGAQDLLTNRGLLRFDRDHCALRLPEPGVEAGCGVAGLVPSSAFWGAVVYNESAVRSVGRHVAIAVERHHGIGSGGRTGRSWSWVTSGLPYMTTSPVLAS